MQTFLAVMLVILIPFSIEFYRLNCCKRPRRELIKNAKRRNLFRFIKKPI